MKNIFNITKEKPLIKFRGYTYIGAHNSYEGINYYIRKYDNHNNYEFMEAKIEGTNGLFKKFMLASGTSIKILDSFMFSYLKHRKDKDFESLLENGFVKKSIEENNFNADLCKMYTNKVPKEIENSSYYKDAIKDGFKVLYVMNNESKDRKYGTIYLTMVKELNQKLLDQDLSYVIFKNTEFVVKPSFVQGKSKEKYTMFELPSLNITTSILK